MHLAFTLLRTAELEKVDVDHCKAALGKAWAVLDVMPRVHGSFTH